MLTIIYNTDQINYNTSFCINAHTTNKNVSEEKKKYNINTLF